MKKTRRKTSVIIGIISKPKNWTELARQGTLWDFSTSILSQTSKKIEGTIWGFFSKKNLTMPKNLKVSSGIVCYARKKEKPFWFSSLGQQIQFGVFLKFCRTFGRTILVTSGVSKKTLTKSHDYSRLFS